MRTIQIVVLVLICGILPNTTLEHLEINIQNQDLSPFAAQTTEYTQNTTDYTITEKNVNIVNSSDFTQVGLWQMEAEGDIGDVNQKISNGIANGTVIGDKREFVLLDNPPQAGDWTMMLNPLFPVYPEWPAGSATNQGTIDQYGCWTRHQWAEGSRQSPSVNWVQNVSMPVDMSDYVITSANISSVVNATVNLNVDTPGDVTQFGVYDYVRFYVSIADLDRNFLFEIASNQTRWLGNNAMNYVDMLDTFMNTIPEDTLIFYLTTVLGRDNRNFTIILGVDIWCEDNLGSDQDDWNSLRIKSVSLNFTYEKRINQGSTMILKQVAPKIEKSAQNVSIIALQSSDFNFQYGLSRAWPASSPNSRIRVKVNGVLFKDIFELPLASTAMVSAFPEEHDITDILSSESSTTIEITIQILDDFLLDQNISVYIDNVVLIISYIEVVFHSPPPPPETPASEPPDNTQQYVIYGLLGMIGGFGVLSVMYLTTWRYPKKVREIRTMRKAMKKGKAHPAESKPTDILFTEAYAAQVGKGINMPYVNKLKIKAQDSGKAKSVASGDLKPKATPKPKAEPKKITKVPEKPSKPEVRNSVSEADLSVPSPSPELIATQTPSLGPKITRPADLLKKPSDIPDEKFENDSLSSTNDSPKGGSDK